MLGSKYLKLKPTVIINKNLELLNNFLNSSQTFSPADTKAPHMHLTKTMEKLQGM